MKKAVGLRPIMKGKIFNAASEAAEDYKPKGKVVKFDKQPMVLRFPPSAYRAVTPEEFKEWRAEVLDRLGLDFDIGPDGGGTVSFCERGGTGAAYRCDSDIEPSNSSLQGKGIGRLRAWDSTPLVLNFPPAAYEILEPDQLKDWAADLKARFGLNFDIGGGAGGTVSFCERGGTGASYRCDSDISPA